jgi:hypothetical protein
MFGGKPRAQGADAAGPDHGDADIVLLHSRPPSPRAGNPRYATCRTGSSRR